MTAHITDHLFGLCSPESRYGRFLVADQLRMCDSSRQPELHTGGVSHASDDEGSLGIVSPRTTKLSRISSQNIRLMWQLGRMLLHGQQTIRQLWFSGCPAFSIHAYCRSILSSALRMAFMVSMS